jgi:hypothetical protein
MEASITGDNSVHKSKALTGDGDTLAEDQDLMKDMKEWRGQAWVGGYEGSML